MNEIDINTNIENRDWIIKTDFNEKIKTHRLGYKLPLDAVMLHIDMLQDKGHVPISLKINGMEGKEGRSRSL